MKKLLSKQNTFLKESFVVCYLVIGFIFLGCRKEQKNIPTAESVYVFGDLVSNEMQNVVWYEAAGSLSVTNQTTIKDLANVLSMIKGVPANFRQKSVVIGDLRYDTNSRTNIIVNFYIRGIVTVNDDIYSIDSKMTDKVVTIIHQTGVGLVDAQP